MKIVDLRIAGFQSFGPEPTTIELDDLSFLVGPNGAGKTAVLQSLVRLFGSNASTRAISTTDFHILSSNTGADPDVGQRLWIEARFEFPEVVDSDTPHETVPGHFSQMKLVTASGSPQMVVRLTATIAEDGEVDEHIFYVIEVDDDGEPSKTVMMNRHDRSTIHVHYLPARRDPSEQVTMAARSMLGRALRSTNWDAEREVVKAHTTAIATSLAGNAAVAGIASELETQWQSVHKGKQFATPSLTFDRGDIDALLRHLSVSFSPGHTEPASEMSKLSDGQQSLLYLSLVISIQGLGRKVLAGELTEFDVDKFRPPVFTLLAMEEPENSLSPHYLGRVLNQLELFVGGTDAQGVIATHAPAMLRRVEPERVRYLRLSLNRQTEVRTITMPKAEDEAHKFVREAVRSYPELYFSRLVVLGEGASEEIVLPRLMVADGMGSDEMSVSVVPLGGRHVNHLWRLLHGLEIPHVTLLDLDMCRHQGGWGRIRYVAKQLSEYSPDTAGLTAEAVEGFPKWDDAEFLVMEGTGPDWIKYLETRRVFFSSPLDIDFAMMSAFADAYEVGDDELGEPDEDTAAVVLGKKHGDVNQMSDSELALLDAYRRRFKGGSKPSAHLSALGNLEDDVLRRQMPESLRRMLISIKIALAGLPE